MEKHILSKSTFLRGQQCLKSLYLYKHYIHLKDPISQDQKALFNRGHAIGEMAQRLFPGGINATPSNTMDYANWVSTTQRLIQQGTEVIYEAAFQSNQVLAILDILVKKNDLWYAYEVKSALKISSVYVWDAAMQYFVIAECGLPLADISIINLNGTYKRGAGVDILSMYNRTSILSAVTEKQGQVRDFIQQQKSVLLSDRIPAIEIGEQCFSPYPCDFYGTCWKHVNKHSVFELGGVARTEQFALYHAGMYEIRQIPDDYPLPDIACTQVQCVKKNEIHMNRPALKAFIKSLRYPLYFWDIESMMPAVPVFSGTSPYEHIPFLFSLCVLKESGGSPIQHYFLEETGIDPRSNFLEKFIALTEGNGDIVVYDINNERKVLQRLKVFLPSLSVAIDDRLARLKDLMLPFQQRHYYHPDMRGSISLKNVLPALVPGESYDKLSINSGTQAMAAFEQLQRETDMFKIEEVRSQLIEYCNQDVLGMVRIVEVLAKNALE